MPKLWTVQVCLKPGEATPALYFSVFQRWLLMSCGYGEPETSVGPRTCPWAGQDGICHVPKCVHPSLSRGKKSKAGTWERAGEEKQSGRWWEMQNKGKEKTSWKSGPWEQKEHPLVSESTRPQPADHIWLQTHSLYVASPLKAQGMHVYEAKTCPGMAVVISPASLGTSMLFHALHPYPHPSPLFEAGICTAPWHIVDYNISGRLLQLSCMSDLGWGISLYTKLSIQVIKIGFFSFCKCNTFHIFTSSCLDSISLFSFLVLALSYLMWISRARCP